MKKLFMSVALLLLVVTSFAQTPGYEFTTVVSHQATPVKDQGSTGTCWCFATASWSRNCSEWEKENMISRKCLSSAKST